MPEKATNGELLLKITYNYKKDRFTESSSSLPKLLNYQLSQLKGKKDLT